MGVVAGSTLAILDRFVRVYALHPGRQKKRIIYRFFYCLSVVPLFHSFLNTGIGMAVPDYQITVRGRFCEILQSPGGLFDVDWFVVYGVETPVVRIVYDMPDVWVIIKTMRDVSPPNITWPGSWINVDTPMDIH